MVEHVRSVIGFSEYVNGEKIPVDFNAFDLDLDPEACVHWDLNDDTRNELMFWFVEQYMKYSVDGHSFTRDDDGNVIGVLRDSIERSDNDDYLCYRIGNVYADYDENWGYYDDDGNYIQDTELTEVYFYWNDDDGYDDDYPEYVDYVENNWRYKYWGVE